MMRIHAKNLDDLWDKVNHAFIYDPEVVDFARPGVSLHSFHNELIADTCECSITLNDLGYTKTKWSMLLRLYFDEYEYKMMMNRLIHYKTKEKRGKVYVPDIGMQFRSRENRTGACLMGLTLRYSTKTGWECSVFSRTNETTARWSVDLIFIHRLIATIGERTGFFEPKDVKLYWTAGSLFQSVVTAPLYMVIMGREKEIIQMIKGKRGELTKWQQAVVKRYRDSYNAKYSETGQLKYQNYKSQTRVTEAYLHLKGKGTKEVKPIPNDSLLIPEVDLTIDEDFFTRGGFR